MTNQTVLVLDFGGKTKENVAKMIRECRVYSRIVAFDIPTEEIKAVNPIGLVLVGDSADVNDSASPKCRPELFELNIPVLGIGYGMHAMTYALMGRVESRKKDENGRVKGLVDVTCPLFADMASDQTMYMSHAQDCRGALKTTHGRPRAPTPLWAIPDAAFSVCSFIPNSICRPTD